MAWKLINCYANRSATYTVDEWNNANQEQRDEMVKPFCRKFIEDKAFKKKDGEFVYSDEDFAEFLEELTQINHHTERRWMEFYLNKYGVRL